MKKLPIGIQSFGNLRSNDYIYVDKTEIVHRIVSEGKIYFLSRPRRFGKSLLISTLDALFRGQEELFEGLYIHNKWNWTQQYPVIRIDWTRISHSTLEEMKNSMCRYLRNIARQYEIKLQDGTPSDCFDELITLLYEKTGKTKIAVLIDEYDKPVTSHLFEPDLDDIRKAVHDFYQVMKGLDDYLQFIFITGVSKFSGLSVFSALNNLDDITLKKEYAAICGYTQEELE
ncbi:MAG: AAA family ATPase, partial [Tannerella sp.]|nr:AAA family ATPase [Tannerella sp.]